MICSVMLHFIRWSDMRLLYRTHLRRRLPGKMKNKLVSSKSWLMGGRTHFMLKDLMGQSGLSFKHWKIYGAWLINIPNRTWIGTENSSTVISLINIFVGVKYNVKVTMWRLIIKLVFKVKDRFTKTKLQKTFQLCWIQENCDDMLPYWYIASFQWKNMY